MSKNKVVIRIVNPLPGGSTYTSPRRAHYFIACKQAEAVGPFLIRFISRLEVAKQIVAEVKIARAAARISDSDPDAGGFATIDQIQGLPCAGDAQTAVRLGKKNFTPRALSRGPVHRLFDGATA